MRPALAVVTGFLALAPTQAAASELQSFELPSSLVDPASPGGKLADGRTKPKVNVLLPDGYDATSKTGYPVLWLLHGAAGGTDNWLPGVKKLAAGLPAVVVMPDGGRVGMYTDWWNGGKRGGPAWATYHLTLLRDEIGRRYRIRPERRWHAIAGISMGGQGALRYAAMLPGYFGSVAGFSAAVPDIQSLAAQVGISLITSTNGDGGVTYDQIFGAASDAYAEGNNPQALAPNYARTRMYLTSGDGVNCPQDPINPGSIAIDTVVEQQLNAQQPAFAAAARAAGAKVTDVTTCGVHTFGVWDRAFAAARAWGFFEPVQNLSRVWSYRTIATAGEMWGLRFRFDAPPTRVATFKRTGRTLAASGSGGVLITGSRDCRFNAVLPFSRRLPRACLRSANA
jgi:S-formylglutathione hydrolase FrmB